MTPQTGYAIADVAALKAITAGDRVDSYARLVAGPGSPPSWYAWYAYNSAYTQPGDDYSSIAPNDGVGRWIRLGTVLPPSEPAPNYLAWYDAGKNVVLNGNQVSTWKDNSLNHYDANAGSYPSNSDTSPFFLADAINGLPAIDFQGYNLLTTSSFNEIAQPNTIFLVGKATVSGFTHRFFSGLSLGNEHILGVGEQGEVFIDAGLQITAPVNSIDVTSSNLYIVEYNGGNSNLNVNNNPILSGDAGSNSLTGFAIGAKASLDFHLRGYIAEIIIYDSITTEGIETTKKYLANKYAVAI